MRCDPGSLLLGQHAHLQAGRVMSLYTSKCALQGPCFEASGTNKRSLELHNDSIVPVRHPDVGARWEGSEGAACLITSL